MKEHLPGKPEAQSIYLASVRPSAGPQCQKDAYGVSLCLKRTIHVTCMPRMCLLLERTLLGNSGHYHCVLALDNCASDRASAQYTSADVLSSHMSRERGLDQ